MSESIESRIRKLEKKICRSVPGTIISRCLVDNDFLKKKGFTKVDRNHQSTLVWAVDIGDMTEPKVYGYGNTISDTLAQIESNE